MPCDQFVLMNSDELNGSSVTVMGRSRSRVAGLELLSRFVEHLLPKLHHRYVMKVDPAATLLRGQHTDQNTIAEYMAYWQ
jgi:hypothetical protein